MQFRAWIVALQTLVAAVGVLLFIWTRPDTRRGAEFCHDQ